MIIKSLSRMYGTIIYFMDNFKTNLEQKFTCVATASKARSYLLFYKSSKTLRLTRKENVFLQTLSIYCSINFYELLMTCVVFTFEKRN